MRPSFNTFDALVATLEDVCFSGALRCERALALGDFDFTDTELLRRVLDALVATVLPVTFLLIIAQFLLLVALYFLHARIAPRSCLHGGSRVDSRPYPLIPSGTKLVRADLRTTLVAFCETVR